MKFARYLSDNLVPEWRYQYLDYKGGKKRLKKLEKIASPGKGQPKNALGVPLQYREADSPASQVARGAFGLRLADDSNEGIKRTTPRELLNASPSITIPNKASVPYPETYGSLIATPPPISGFHLPPPALAGTADVPHNDHPSGSRSVTFPADADLEQGLPSPLGLGTPALPVEGTSRRKRALSSLSRQVTNQSDRSGQRKPQVVSRATSILSAKDQTFKRMQEEPDYREFIEWLDQEFDKISTFYHDKEVEAVSRFIKIKEQLHLMRDQKIQERDRLQTVATFETTQSSKRRKPASVVDKGAAKLAAFCKKLDLHHLPFSTKPHLAGNGNRDYARSQAAATVPYNVARRKLKNAVLEYYRGLELLKSYRLLNRTGMQKITKKFDKTTDSYISGWYMDKVNSSYFGQSAVIDDLMNQTEDIYSRYFERGNRKHAVEKLRTREQVVTYYNATLITGLFLGFGLPLFIQAVVIGVQKGLRHEINDVAFLFQLFGGSFLMIMFGLLFGINCMVWSRYKINYPFIFEWDQHNFLNYREFLEIPSVLFFWLSLCMYLCFSDFWPDRMPQKWYPLLFVGSSSLLIFLPLPLFRWRAREWLVIALWRLVLSGFYPVEFRDFFLGDIFCSLTYSVSNIDLFFCLYAANWRVGARCGSNVSRLMGFLNALPPIWRFLQCWRRFVDTRNWFPHLANAGKYTFTIATAVMLSIWRIQRIESNRDVYILFATINTLYSSFWDLFMDWSLFQPGSKFWLLRNELGFRNPNYYYIAMVVDPLLRLNWIFYVAFPVQLQQSATLSFFIALVEVVRRFLWIFFRMENEHCTNVGRFVASRNMPLPYELDDGEREMDEINVRTPLMTADQGRASELSSSVPPSQPLPMTNTPASLRRRRSTMTPHMVATAMSSAIRGAHAQDFERRKNRRGSDSGKTAAGSIVDHQEFDSDDNGEEAEDAFSSDDESVASMASDAK